MASLIHLGESGSQKNPAFIDALAILLIVTLGAAVRLVNLDSRGLDLDELWTVELSTSRGSAHLHLPLNVLMRPPELFSLSDAPPWWKLWTTMECTNPPLHFIALRFWTMMFGQSDLAARMLSVICSLAGIAILYNTAQLLNGRRVAIWAAILLAVAQPQVDYARQVRHYAMLLPLALLAANAIVRIEVLGFSRRRIALFSISLLATLLTHYFCIGAIVALAIYALVRLRGPARIWVMTAMLMVGFIYAIIWGPFMWQQRSLFANNDQGTSFLHESGPKHLSETVKRFLSMPASLLSLPRRSMRLVSSLMAVLYVLPFLMIRRRPDLLFWNLWLVCVVLPLLILDLARDTAHLGFVRYSLLAGPAVYALIPGLLSLVVARRWMRHVVPAVTAIACALAVPDVYHPWQTNTRLIAAEMRTRMSPQDMVVFSGVGENLWQTEVQYLMLHRYLHRVPCPMAVVDLPLAGDVSAYAQHSRYVFAFSVGNPLEFLPHMKIVAARMYLGGGLCAQVSPMTPSTEPTK